MRSLLICSVPVLLLAAELTAQQPRAQDDLDTAVAAGQRVRVVTGGSRERFVGEFAAFVDDSLFLTVEGRATPLPIPTGQIIRLEVSRGEETLAGLGTVIGGSGGLVAGIVIYGNNKTDCPEGDNLCELGDFDNFLVIPGMVLVGALAGNLIGRLFKTEIWEPLPVENLRLGFGASPESDYVTVNVRFVLQ